MLRLDDDGVGVAVGPGVESVAVAVTVDVITIVDVVVEMTVDVTVVGVTVGVGVHAVGGGGMVTLTWSSQARTGCTSHNTQATMCCCLAGEGETMARSLTHSPEQFDSRLHPFLSTDTVISFA